MRPEDLSRDQQRFIDMVFRHWEREGSWPERLQVIAWMHKESIDHERHLSRPPLYPFVGSVDQIIELTLYGVAAATGGEAWVSLFVPLVQRGVDLFLEDPRGTPLLTEAHLQALAPEWPRERIKRAAQLYRQELLRLGGYRNTTAGFQVELRSGCLKYRPIRTIWEYQSRHGRLRRAEQFTADQRRMALWAFERWRETGQCPNELEVVLQHLDLPDPVGVWEGMPGQVFGRELNADARGFLGIRELLALRPETDDSLDALARLLGATRELYLRSGRPPEIADVARRAAVAEAAAMHVLEVAGTIPGGGLRLLRNDGQIKIDLSESILRFDVKTADGLVQIISEADEKERREYEALSEQHYQQNHADESEEVAADADAFQGLNLHPRIAEVAWPLFSTGHYRHAVSDAALALNALVQERSGVSDKDGVALMRQVFSKNEPLLAFNDLSGTSDRDEQEGFMHLFEGAMMALRNPRAHRLDADERGPALEYITLLSFLAKWAERALPRSDASNKPVNG